MRLLMIVHGFAPECTGGTESYVLRSSRELINRGHQVEILCGSHEGAGPDRQEPRVVVSHHQGVRVHRVHRTGLYVDSWEKGMAPELEGILDSILREFRPDLVHVHHWIRLTRNLIELCHDRGVPAVCTLHDLWTTCPMAFRVHDMRFRDPADEHAPCPLCAPAGESMGADEAARELELFRDDFLNEVALARRVIVPSIAHRELIRRCHPGVDGRLRVVPHGDIIPFRSPPHRFPEVTRFPDAPLVIGHWGHLSRLKGTDVLLEALHELADTSRIRLELFGDIVYPDERDTILNLLEGLAVTRHGAYEPRQLLQVPMDLAVISTRCSESWSFVLSEAFLLGLPCLVPDRGALPERLAGAGDTFAAEDAADLARKLELVLEEPARLQAWKTRIPALDPPAEHAERLERVYREVVTSRAQLPTTSQGLRSRRMLSRSLQVEARNRMREEDLGLIRNLQSDLRRARSSMKEMDHFHREKDKELLRLKQEVEHKRELIEVMGASLTDLAASVEDLERRRRRDAVSSGRNGHRPSPHKRRLKILMVLHQFLPRHVAGTEVYSFNLARQLSAEHDVVILTAESDHSRQRFEETRHMVQGLPVRQVIHNYKWENFEETYDCPEADAIFRRVLREEQPDVVHIQHLQYWSANFITIAHGKGIPVVYTLHDFSLLCPRDGQMRRADGELCIAPVPDRCADCIREHDLSESSPPSIPRDMHPGADSLVPPDVSRAIHRLRERTNVSLLGHEGAIADRLAYLRRIVADVDLFISPSRFLRDLFVANEFARPEQIIVSDNGIDLTGFEHIQRRRFPLARLRVGYVGTIAEHKGLDTLVDAMKLVDDERVTCRIWGELRAFREYTDQLRDRIGNGRVLLMGSFPNERIEDILASLDVLVIPSLWYENSPITIHEAALANLPVIVSDLGGMKEYVTPGVTGLVFPAGDARALADTLLELFESPGPLVGFDASRLEIKDIQADARDMASRYRELLERAATPPRG